VASPGVGWSAQPDQAPVARQNPAAPAPAADPDEIAPAWAPVAAGLPAAESAASPHVDEFDDEEVERKPRHPYTWLHLIVLALVAFVLGFLIMLLVVNGRPDGSASGATTGGVHLASSGAVTPSSR
ncbi:hypothetical protein, partial [Cellulomonas rhizosphaerae]|uniref:hypothetical protein n=1 Tax=Cellulomonas rhizosphaerae TaxID=2293719 RepID=UPI0018F674D5